MDFRRDHFLNFSRKFEGICREDGTADEKRLDDRLHAIGRSGPYLSPGEALGRWCVPPSGTASGQFLYESFATIAHCLCSAPVCSGAGSTLLLLRVHLGSCL